VKQHLCGGCACKKPGKVKGESTNFETIVDRKARSRLNDPYSLSSYWIKKCKPSSSIGGSRGRNKEMGSWRKKWKENNDMASTAMCGLKGLSKGKTRSSGKGVIPPGGGNKRAKRQNPDAAKPATGEHQKGTSFAARIWKGGLFFIGGGISTGGKGGDNQPQKTRGTKAEPEEHGARPRLAKERDVTTREQKNTEE